MRNIFTDRAEHLCEEILWYVRIVYFAISSGGKRFQIEKSAVQGEAECRNCN